MAGRLMRFDGSSDCSYADGSSAHVRRSATWGDATNSFTCGGRFFLDAPGGGSSTLMSEVGPSGITFEVLNVFGTIYLYIYRSSGAFRSYKGAVFTAIPHRQVCTIAITYDAPTDTPICRVNGTVLTLTAGDAAIGTAQVGGTSFRLGASPSGVAGRMTGWCRDVVVMRGALSGVNFAVFANDPLAYCTDNAITPERRVLGYAVADSAGTTDELVAGVTTVSPTVTGTITYSGVQYAAWESFWYSPTTGVTVSGSDVTAWADQIGCSGSMADGSSNKCHKLTSPSAHICAPGHSDLTTAANTAGVGISTRMFSMVGVIANPYRRALRGGITQVGCIAVGYGSSGTSTLWLCYDNQNAVLLITADNSGALVETKTPLDSGGRKLIMPASRFRFGVSLGPSGVTVMIGSQVGTASAFTAAQSTGSLLSPSGLMGGGTTHKTNIDHYGFRGGHVTLTSTELALYMAAGDPDSVGLDPLAARAMLCIGGTSLPNGSDGSIASPATHDNKGWCKYLEAQSGYTGVVMYNWCYGGSNIYDLGGTTDFQSEMGRQDLFDQLTQIPMSRRIGILMDGANSITTTCVAATEYASSRAVGVLMKALYGKVIKVAETPRTDAPNYNTTARHDRLLAFNAAHAVDVGVVWDQYIDIEALSAFHVAAGYSTLAHIQVITTSATVYSALDVVHWRHTAGGGHPVAIAFITTTVAAVVTQVLSGGGGRMGRDGWRNDRRAMVAAA